MFGSLFRKAQATVDNAIDQFVNRAAIAVPLLVAGGFATAAASIRLHREFDAETANMILAAGFIAIALLTALLVQPRATDSAADEGVVPSATSGDPSPGGSREGGEIASDVDRELLMAALSTAGPMALPGLMRIVSRNLPLIAAVAAAAFVITRPSDGARDGDIGNSNVQPAE